MSAILADQIALLLPFEAEFTPISSPFKLRHQLFKDYHVYVYVKRLVVIFHLKMHFVRTF